MSKGLQIKRNYNIFDSKEEAIQHLNDILNTLFDGEIVLCRYNEGNSLKTIIGVVQDINDSKTYTLFDSISDVGNGLNRKNDGSLEIKLSNKENEKNFLEIDEENKGLKVVGVDADKVTTKEITVIGTPLANLIYGEGKQGIIPSGSNIQTILEELLSQELWPVSITLVNGSVSGKITPSVSSTNMISGVNNSGTYEVGTSCQLKELPMPTTVFTYTKEQVNGLTYGYSMVNDNTRDSTATTIQYEHKVEESIGNLYKIELKYTGFSASQSTVTVSGESSSTVKIQANTNLKIVEGTNKVSAVYTAPGKKITYEPIPTIYACSNLGKTNADHSFNRDANDYASITSVSALTEFSVTGVRYGFYGCVSDDFVINSANIRALTSFTNKGSFTIKGDDVEQVIVAIPSSWGKKVSSVIAVEQANQGITGAYVKYNQQVAVNGANGYVAENYDVYVYNPETVVKVEHNITLASK
jgi:hypothetical protein